MTTIADIRLLSQRKARGTYAIHPNAIGDDGAITVAVPDDYEVRVLHFTQHCSAERPTIVETVSVETLRSLQLSPDGTVGIGITDDDFYIFNNGRKTRFLTDRRLAYHSIALAGNGRFAYVASDLLMHGYAIGLGDSSNRLLWTKDLQQPTELVAISPSGKFIAVAGTAGEVYIFTDTRDVLLTIHSGLFPISLCIDNDATMAIVGRDMVDNQIKAKVTDATGEYRLATDIDGEPCGISVLPGGETVAVPTVVDARSGKVVFVGDHDDRGEWEVLIDAGCPSGIALSPDGTYLGVSTRDGAIYRFEVDSVAKAAFSDVLALETFRKLLNAGDIAQAIRDFCHKWVSNQTPEFSDSATHAASELVDALASLTLAEFVTFLKHRTSYPEKFIAPEVFTRAIVDAAAMQLRRELVSKTADIMEQLDVLTSIYAITALVIIGPDVACEVRTYVDSVGLQVFQEMSSQIASGNLDRAAKLAVDAAKAGLVNEDVQMLQTKINLERTLQDANARYDAKDFSGALFGYRKVLKWLPDNREIRARIHFAEAMVSDSGLQDRFSRLE